MTTATIMETEENSRMFSFTKLKRLYNLYKKEKAVALKEEKDRLKEERMSQRNPFRPWRKYNDKEALEFAIRKLRTYIDFDEEVRSHFDEVIEYFNDMEKSDNVKVSNIEIDEREYVIIEMFKEIHEIHIAKTLDGVDLSYNKED